MSNDTSAASTGCLSLLFAWFLLDMTVKAIFWGVASIFGVQIPPLSKVVQVMLCGFLAPFGIIGLAIIGYLLYLFVSDFLSGVFGKNKKDKENDNERNR